MYQNHLMGSQTGNLRAQLVRGGICPDMEAAKTHMRRRLVVQVLVVHDDQKRASLEHMILAVLQPTYCD